MALLAFGNMNEPMGTLSFLNQLFHLSIAQQNAARLPFLKCHHVAI